MGEEIEELGREEGGGGKRQSGPKGPQDGSREREEKSWAGQVEKIRRGEEVREGGHGCKDLKRSWGGGAN